MVEETIEACISISDVKLVSQIGTHDPVIELSKCKYQNTSQVNTFIKKLYPTTQQASDLLVKFFWKDRDSFQLGIQYSSLREDWMIILDKLLTENNGLQIFDYVIIKLRILPNNLFAEKCKLFFIFCLLKHMVKKPTDQTTCTYWKEFCTPNYQNYWDFLLSCPATRSMTKKWLETLKIDTISHKPVRVGYFWSKFSQINNLS